MSLDKMKNVKFTSGEPEGKDRIFIIDIHVIGDLKGLFYKLGERRFYSLCCAHYMCRPKEWKFSHSLSSSRLSCEKWTLQQIPSISFSQLNGLK